MIAPTFTYEALQRKANPILSIASSFSSFDFAAVVGVWVLVVIVHVADVSLRQLVF